MSKESMKLALEALQEVYWSSRSAKHDEAITALREALAEQPAPVNALDEMWVALAGYQPQADENGHGETWAKMCKEKTAKSAYAASDDNAADSYGDVSAGSVAAAVYNAIIWTKKAFKRIEELKEKT